MLVKPFLDDNPHGVFATRSPAGPNTIGISTVRLIRTENKILYIQDVDILDGTPLLDIKPYVPKFDYRRTTKIGWSATKLASSKKQRVMADFANRNQHKTTKGQLTKQPHLKT